MESKPQDETPENDKTECIENKLRELREHIRKMEKENEELFETLGVSPHQVQNFLNDKSKFSADAFEFIQRERHALESILERRLDEVRDSSRKDNPPEPPKIGGHWILMR